MDLLISFLVLLLLLVVSALPLYITIKILGGRVSLLRTIFVMFFSGIIISLVSIFLRNTLASFVSFLLVIFLYRFSFRLKWWKAFVAWFLQFVVLVFLIILFGFLGLSLLFF